MVYMGSKNRIAKYILPFLTKYLTDDRKKEIEKLFVHESIADKYRIKTLFD